MNIREINSYVRERCGSPSLAVLHPEEIDLLVLAEVSLRQGQMTEAGKQLKTFVDTLGNFSAKTAAVSVSSGKTPVRPDYVRIDFNGSGVFDLMEIVNDVDALTLAESEGRYAILFFGIPLNYEVTWTPTGHETIQLWTDSEVSTLLEMSTGGTRLPKRFDFAVGDAAAIKCFPIIIDRDDTKRTFADLQSRIVAADLVRWESSWNQFLYQSVTAGSPTQKGRYHSSAPRRIRNFPY